MGIIDELNRLEASRLAGIETSFQRQEDEKKEELKRQIRDILRNPDQELDEPIIMDVEMKIPQGIYYVESELPETPEIIRRKIAKERIAGETIHDIIVTTQRAISLEKLVGCWIEGGEYITSYKERESNEPRTDIEKIVVESFRKKIERIKTSTSSELDENGILEYHIKNVTIYTNIETTLREALLGAPNMYGQNFRSYSKIQEEQSEANNSASGIIQELYELDRSRNNEIEMNVEQKRREYCDKLLEILRNPAPQLDEPIIMDVKIRIPFDESLKLKLPETPEIIRRKKAGELGRWDEIEDIIVTTQRAILVQELGCMCIKGSQFIITKEARDSNEPKTDIERQEVETLKRKIQRIKYSASKDLDETGIIEYIRPEGSAIESLEVTLREALLGAPNQNGQNFKSYSKLQEEQRKADKSLNRITLSSIGRTVKNWLRRGER